MWIGFLAVFGLLSVATCSASEGTDIHNHVEENFGEPLPLYSPDEHQHEAEPISPVALETSFSNCLIFAVADNLKEHLTTYNVKPVTVLLQHSIQTCPGLNSTFEVFQKIMGFRGLDFAGVMNFINSIQVHNGTVPTTEAVDEEIEHGVDVAEEETIESPVENKIEDHEIVKVEEPAMPENQEQHDAEAMPSANADSAIHDEAIDDEETPDTPVEQESIADNYEDAIPVDSIEANHEASLSDANEDHKAEYLKFWNEELLQNTREAQRLQAKMN